jgi:hypothetical protein
MPHRLAEQYGGVPPGPLMQIHVCLNFSCSYHKFLSDKIELKIETRFGRICRKNYASPGPENGDGIIF